MRAVAFDRHGGVEVLDYRDCPDPQPAQGEVVVRVRATGLNYLDVFARRGMPGVSIPLPFISGGEIAGEIDTVGDGVTGWRAGERVVVNPKTKRGLIGEEVNGGLAERVAVPAENLVRLPESVSFEDGAAIPLAFGPALRTPPFRAGRKCREGRP